MPSDASDVGTALTKRGLTLNESGKIYELFKLYYTCFPDAFLQILHTPLTLMFLFI